MSHPCLRHIHGLRDGTVAERLNIPTIRRLPVPRFTTFEQKSIASLLGALDDKIDLNRRMNETLEAMARAIFKDWLVDFGPVRAKAEGHPPYLAPEIWELFPDAFDDEDKPLEWEFWEFGFLADVADSPRRGINPSDIPDETPYIGLEHMPRRSIALTEWENSGNIISNKSVFKKGEFLFGKLRPYFHKVGVAPIDGICSTDIIVVQPRKPIWSAFVILSISTDEFVDYTDKISTGTKMPRTKWSDMGRHMICLPSVSVAHCFQILIQPLVNKIIGDIYENKTLAQLRDLLISKPMSGEIRLRDAEKAVEAMV